MAQKYDIRRATEYNLRAQIMRGLNSLSERLGGPDPTDPNEPYGPDYNFGTVRWQGEWESQEYYKDDMVRDGDWTMIANTDTTDRAAPQPVGAEFSVYDGAEPTRQDTAKQILFGNRYTYQVGGFINGYRIYAIAGNTYRIFLVEDPLGTPIINELQLFVAGNSGWADFATGSRVVPAGTVFDVVVLVYEPDPTPTVFTGNWNYTTPQNAGIPGAGVIIHPTKTLGVMSINTTDNDAGDRRAELLSLAVGDIIEGANQRWAIQSITDNTTWFDFGVSPASQGTPSGVQSFNFETVTSTPITYIEDVNYWPTSPYPQIEGIVAIDEDYADATINSNAYGVDIFAQEAYVSPDWDVVAVSSGAGGPGSVTAGIAGGIVNIGGFWDDIQNSLVGRRLSSSSGTVDYNWSENTIEFSPNGSITDTNDVVNWNIQLPHGAKTDSELGVHIHYEQTDNTTREITIRYRIQTNGETKETAWTTVSVNTAGSVWPYSSGTLNNILPLVRVDLSGTKVSDVIQFQMTRTDNESGVMPVLFADAHVFRDSLGSAGEFG